MSDRNSHTPTPNKANRTGVQTQQGPHGCQADTWPPQHIISVTCYQWASVSHEVALACVKKTRPRVHSSFYRNHLHVSLVLTCPYIHTKQNKGKFRLWLVVDMPNLSGQVETLSSKATSTANVCGHNNSYNWSNSHRGLAWRPQWNRINRYERQVEPREES